MSNQLIIQCYRFTESIMFKQLLKFALFATFSFWLLYHIRQPTGNSGSEYGIQLSNEHMSSFLGRKGIAGLSKFALNPYSSLTLEDVTNPGEEGDIPSYTKEIEAVQFYTKTGFLNERNYVNTYSSGENGQTMDGEDGSLIITKSKISFPDENGIPQHVRDRFIEVEPSNLVKSSRVKIQSRRVITTRVNDGRNGSVDKS